MDDADLCMITDPGKTKKSFLDSNSKEKIEQEFQDIVGVHIHGLLKNISNADKLKLYALYKQSTQGDAQKSFLSMVYNFFFDPKKYEWGKLYGMVSTDAKLEYVNTFKLLKYLDTLAMKDLACAVKLIDKTNERLEWDKTEHKKHNLEPHIEQGYTTVFIDQLTDELSYEYARTTRLKYALVRKAKPFSDLHAQRLPSPMKNTNFIKVFTETHLSKHLYAFDEIANSSALNFYLELFKIKNDEKYFLADLTTVIGLPVKLDDKCNVAPSVVLFERIDGKFNVIAIAAKNLIFQEKPLDLEYFPAVLGNMNIVYPNDGVAWELAKLHSLHNAHYTMTVGIHTLLHFPLASPIAIISDKMLTLPSFYTKHSVCARIIKAHSYLETPVDSHALNSAESVLWATKTTYYPWCFGEKNGMSRFIKLITEGWQGHPIYRGGGEDLTILRHHYDLGCRKLLFTVRQIVESFIDKIYSIIGESAVEKEFADIFLRNLKDILPKNSFLKKNDLMEGYNSMAVMKKILSYYVHNVFHHAVDHGMYEVDVLDSIPLRIRKPIPFNNKSQNPLEIIKEISTINTMTDRSSFEQAREMFFNSLVERSLHDFIEDGGYFPQKDNVFLPTAPYDDKTAALISAQEEFFHHLVDKFNSDDSPVDISQIAISIQS